MQHQGLFKEGRKTKAHGTVNPNQCILGWPCWKGWNLLLSGTRHSVGVSA